VDAVRGRVSSGRHAVDAEDLRLSHGERVTGVQRRHKTERADEGGGTVTVNAQVSIRRRLSSDQV
jgi:hypothetical protein